MRISTLQWKVSLSRFHHIHNLDEDDTDDEFFATSGTKTTAKRVFVEDDDIDTRLPGPNYLNNSFTGPYPEDMNRGYVDKGPNQQFLNLSDDDE